MPEEFKCEHCGKVVEDEWELDIKHRACRFKAAFPDAATELGGGLVSFNIKKIQEQLGMKD